VPLTTSLHFTPDGVSAPLHVITINIAPAEGFFLTDNVFRIQLAPLPGA